MTDLRAQIEQLKEKWRERERTLCRKADNDPSLSYASRLADRAEIYAHCADQVEALLADHAAPVVAPSGKRYDLAYSIARRIVGSTSGTQTIDAIAESLILFPDESPTVQLLAAPVVGETPSKEG
jgi:hypothetical protein